MAKEDLDGEAARADVDNNTPVKAIHNSQSFAFV
jgi:hypothetical protein